MASGFSDFGIARYGFTVYARAPRDAGRGPWLWLALLRGPRRPVGPRRYAAAIHPLTDHRQRRSRAEVLCVAPRGMTRIDGFCDMLEVR